MDQGWAVLGRAMHAPRQGEVEDLPQALIAVDAAGMITVVETAVDEDDPRVAAYRAAGRLTTLGADQVLLPGLVDLHVHAPQFPQTGTALDVPLEDWLQRHTFPLESRYADLAFAEVVYARLVETLLAHGTTTALYFATVHVPATQRLAELCLARGQRALIGRVAMDHPEQCPPYYRDPSAAQAVADTRAVIDFIRAMPGNEGALVQPVVTPRFVPACTDALLEGLGALAQECGCHVQTHCSESDWEHAHVLERTGLTDTATLARAGLLGRRSVLAHGNFVEAADRAMIRAAGAAIAHCPLSNAFFAGAVLPLSDLLAEGLHVGLGSDLAGGPAASLFAQARMAVVASRMRETGTNATLAPSGRGEPRTRIDALTAFHLATAGGGQALDLPIGLFRPGHAFDAIALESGLPDGDLLVTQAETAERVVEKAVMTAGRGDIARVWVQGRLVKSR
ncbi:amidohydrolase family protein [Acidisoma sp. 7E03]